jgi:hypothetical protein
MIEYVFKPIDKWPREFTKERKRRAPFHQVKTVTQQTFSGGATYTQKIRQDLPFDRIVRELSIEVERHGAKKVIIQLALPESQIRRDGLPYSTAKPDHPGVIVAFQTKHGPVKMPCDTFAHWQDNLRAISVTLEHLRGVDRYGVTQHGEQYRGWAALPASSQAMSGSEAADFISRHCEYVPASWIMEKAEAFKTAYKVAAAKLHPDNQDTGNAEEFKTLQAAADVLKAHFGNG